MPAHVRECCHQSVLSCKNLYEERLFQANKRYLEYKVYVDMATRWPNCVGIKRQPLNPEEIEGIYRVVTSPMYANGLGASSDVA